LLHDLASIVVAVREGRGNYDNVRKVVDYLVAGYLFRDHGRRPVPRALSGPRHALLPLQLLWVNLLTDGLPGIALGVDRPDHA
jgi:Ca2+-transporting ATPase